MKYKRGTFQFISFLLFVFNLNLVRAVDDQVFYFYGDISNPITYGLEVEFLPNDSNKKILITNYRPSAFTEEEWASKDEDTKFYYINELLAKRAVTKKWQKLSNSTLVHFPPTFIQDSNGNLEFNGFIYSRGALEITSFMRDFQRLFGEGDFQGHVVFDYKKAQKSFQTSSGLGAGAVADTGLGIDKEDHEEKQQQEYFPLHGSAGYALYEHDRAFLKKVEFQYDAYNCLLKQGKAEAQLMLPAGNLFSKFLCPFSDHAMIKTQQIVEIMSSGKEIPSDERVDRYNGPSLRTQSYGADKLGFEIRQWDHPSGVAREIRYPHNREELLESMQRLAVLLSNKDPRYNLNQFLVYEKIDVPMCDSMKFWERRSAQLKEEFPTQDHGIDFDKIENILTRLGNGGLFEVNSLLYPLRNWTQYPLVSGISNDVERRNQQAKIARATVNYLKFLQDLSWREIQGRRAIPVQELELLKDKIRVAVAKWVNETQLAQLFPEPPAEKTCGDLVAPGTDQPDLTGLIQNVQDVQKKMECAVQ